MPGLSPNRWAEFSNGARLGERASMETIELNPEADWQEVEGLESEAPFEVGRPFFKKNYNGEGVEVAARVLKRTPMAGGDAEYVQIDREQACMAQMEENCTAQKGPKEYLGNALRIGVYLFETYTPRVLRGPAQVKSSGSQKTTSSMPQKEKSETSKVGDNGTDALLGATAKRLTREQEAKCREERRLSELTARFKQ